MHLERLAIMKSRRKPPEKPLENLESQLTAAITVPRLFKIKVTVRRHQ
jgi:hypothetical protein